MWPCLPARKRISDAMDGQPVPGLMGLYVAFHRNHCPYCKRFEQSLKHTVALGRALRELPFEEDDGPAPKAETTPQKP